MTDLQMKCFISLAENLNFTKAANELCISQSTLSMHIKVLEKNIDLTLFIRSKRHVELSPEGEIMLEVIKDVNHRLEVGIERARTLHKNHANVLRIGYMMGLSSDKFFISIINSFQKYRKNTKIEVNRMTNRDLINEIEKDRLDIGFSLDRTLSSRKKLKGISILEAPTSMAISSAKVAGKEEVTFEDFRNEPLILLSKEVDPTDYGILETFKEKFDYTPPKIMTMNSAEAIIMSVSFGMGVCFSDHTSIGYGRPDLYYLDFPEYSISCDVICKKEYLNPEITTFMEFIEKNYKI